LLLYVPDEEEEFDEDGVFRDEPSGSRSVGSPSSLFVGWVGSAEVRDVEVRRTKAMRRDGSLLMLMLMWRDIVIGDEIFKLSLCVIVVILMTRAEIIDFLFLDC